MKVLDAHYALFCYADGECIDDLFVYMLPEMQAKDGGFYFFLAINASNREKDMTWVKNHVRGFNVEVKDKLFVIKCCITKDNMMVSSVPG